MSPGDVSTLKARSRAATGLMIAGLMLGALTACSPGGSAAPITSPSSSTPASAIAASSAATPVPSPAAPAEKTVRVVKSTHRSSDKSCTAAKKGGRCPYVEITTTGMSGAVTCTIHDDVQEKWDSHSFPAPVTNVRYWYYGLARKVWVVCDGIESNKVSW